MLPDYHIHTVLCRHAEGEIGAYRESARQLHLPEICFTDHVPNPDGYDPGNRMTLNEFPRYRALVAQLPTDGEPAVLFGLEADYYEGGVAFLQQWLPRQTLDLVIGSVHYLENWGVDDPVERQVWDQVDVTAVWREYFLRLGRMVDTHLFDVVGHLDLPKKFGHRPPDPDVRKLAAPVLDKIAAAGMVVEINSAGLRKPVREIYPSPLLLQMACDREIPICFGSDAHRPDEVGFRFDDSLRLAKSAGYSRAVRFSKRRKLYYDLS